MKERPILFNADMVNAILDGRKTQTRRIVKPTKDRNGSGCHLAPCEIAGEVNGGDYGLSPYGQPGDRLWVRETHGYKIRSVGGTPHESIVYRASEPDAVRCYGSNGEELPMKWKPSIFMPRRHSRITLEIVSVRVERLQHISEADAIAEGIELPENGTYRDYGVKPEDNEGHDYCNTAVDSYRTLWQKINGLDSWAANPWVWVVELKRVEASQ